MPCVFPVYSCSWTTLNMEPSSPSSNVLTSSVVLCCMSEHGDNFHPMTSLVLSTSTVKNCTSPGERSVRRKQMLKEGLTEGAMFSLGEKLRASCIVC